MSPGRVDQSRVDRVTDAFVAAGDIARAAITR
jgi:hypothetical protein